MTVLVAIRDADQSKTTIYADSQATDGLLRMYVDNKVTVRGRGAIGICGDTLGMTWARQAPALAEDDDADDWVDSLVANAFEWLSERNATDSDDGAPVLRWEMLVATAPAIYRVSSVGGIIRFSEPYAAIGSGGPIAMGVLDCLRPHATLNECALSAMRVACERADGCGGMIRTVEIDW